MPKVKAYITKVGTTGSRFWYKPEGWDSLIGGFGKVPEDIQAAYDNTGEIEIEYHIYENDGKTYYNHGPEKKSKGTTQTSAAHSTSMVSVEKTIQEKDYEPLKIGVNITFPNTDGVNNKMIQSAIDIAVFEVNQAFVDRLGRGISGKKSEPAAEPPKSPQVTDSDYLPPGSEEKPNKKGIPNKTQESIPEAIFKAEEKKAVKI